ncbi:hypothetical protein SASPL_108205 [Salvia splendens]|uniref:Uncharacterized protein n=1 Tax=Salvia splendens TaxID=180675 RepID=A0A8X8YIC5_SALSN|nr:hypothetical protein SASPL_108205 [Salvia splendens]
MQFPALLEHRTGLQINACYLYSQMAESKYFDCIVLNMVLHLSDLFRGVFWKAATIGSSLLRSIAASALSSTSDSFLFVYCICRLSISGVNTLEVFALWQRMTGKDGAFYAAALPR